jgi:hypothetical protein
MVRVRFKGYKKMHGTNRKTSLNKTNSVNVQFIHIHNIPIHITYHLYIYIISTVSRKTSLTDHRINIKIQTGKASTGYINVQYSIYLVKAGSEASPPAYR